MAPPRDAKKCAARGGMTRWEVVEAVFARDGSKCRTCGMSDDEHRAMTGRALQVRRLQPGTMYRVDGCELRCQKCHGPEPRRPRGTKDAEGYGGVTVWLPIAYRSKLRELCGLTRRPITTEVQIALEAHLISHGVEPPTPE